MHGRYMPDNNMNAKRENDQRFKLGVHVGQVSLDGKTRRVKRRKTNALSCRQVLEFATSGDRIG